MPDSLPVSLKLKLQNREQEQTVSIGAMRERSSGPPWGRGEEGGVPGTAPSGHKPTCSVWCAVHDMHSRTDVLPTTRHVCTDLHIHKVHICTHTLSVHMWTPGTYADLMHAHLTSIVYMCTHTHTCTHVHSCPVSQRWHLRSYKWSHLFCYTQPVGGPTQTPAQFYCAPWLGLRAH